MRVIVFVFSILMCSQMVFAQAETDSTIYQVVKEMPRFPGCEEQDTTMAAKYKCSQQVLLSFVYQNIVYPLEARQENISGTVVASFVVEKDGSVSQPTLLKDIGGGCGDATLKVIDLINKAGVRFRPGQKDGKPVRVRMTIPVKFELKEAPPYVVVDGDSIWVQLDTPLQYLSGDEGLSTYLEEKVKYPDSALDSCLVGNINVQIRVDRQGGVKVLDMTDYCNLGFDFWFETTNAMTSTYGQWMVATYDGNPVPSVYEVTIPFRPTASAACQTKIADFDAANQMANDAVKLYSEEKVEEALAKLTEAIRIFPDNASHYYLRGQIYINQKEFTKACEDLAKAKEIAQLNDYDEVMSVICR
ncbi:MAG: energy transducer TonB [Saprospiraceae bacterium]|nr:energy transducer TonB [Saprospiraceae bacterium]